MNGDHIRQHRLQALDKIKRDLAQSILLRIHEEVAENPDITEFSTPMLRSNDVATRILRNYPELVSGRIKIGRAVTLRLNEDVTPPELVISIGD